MVVNIDNKPEEVVEEAVLDKAQKASLSDLELSYDRKFNAFCLSVSSYSPEKLRNTLLQKQNALSAAQKEKKEAKDRYAKLAAQLKIDYLKNTIDKTNALIKRKSKAAAQSAAATPKKKAVSESVEVLNELFGKKKQQSKQDPAKPKGFIPLTKEEFDKCVKIFKDKINKYPLVKKCVLYEDPKDTFYKCCSSYEKYQKNNENGSACIALIDTDLLNEDELDNWMDEQFGDFYYDDLNKEFEKLDFANVFKYSVGPVECIGIKSTKPLESTNEAGKLGSKFKEEINGTNYSFRTREVNITPEIKEKVITKAKQYLAKENSIKKQVYTFKKNSSKEEFEKDRIEGFEIINPIHNEYKKDEFELGIFFSSVNQYYTMVDKRGKIYEKDTMTT